MKVFVAIDTRNVLVYMVKYKTKLKDKFVNIWLIPKRLTTWTYSGIIDDQIKKHKGRVK